MNAVSPFRKVVPLLVWPVGIVLLLGYCSIGRGERSTTVRVDRPPHCAPGETCSNVSRSVAVAAPRSVDLRIPVAVVAGLILFVAGRSLARGRQKNGESGE